MRRLLVALTAVLCLLPTNLVGQTRMSETVFRGRVYFIAESMPPDSNDAAAQIRRDLVQREICDVGLDFSDPNILGRVGVWRDELCRQNLERLSSRPVQLHRTLKEVDSYYQEEVRKGGTAQDGKDGTDGVNCWDTNKNHTADAIEDTNKDGRIDVIDCRGGDGKNAIAPPPAIVREQIVRTGIPWKPILITIGAAGVVAGGLCLSDIIDCGGDKTTIKNDNINVFGDVIQAAPRPRGGFVFGVRLN
jgi:hypothetical protein